MIARGGRHDASHVPGVVRVWTTLVRTNSRLRAACPRRSHVGIPRYLQPNGDRHAGTPWMVPYADVRLSRMAGRTDRRCGALFCADSPRRAQCAMAASSGMVLRVGHVLQRSRAHRGDDPGAHGRERAGRATGARILFLAIAFHRIGVADDAIVEDGSQIPISNASVFLNAALLVRRACAVLFDSIGTAGVA